MGKTIDLFMQIAFELGQAYQNIYYKIGLENIVDFNNIILANSRGAQWSFKGDMSDLPKLFEIHKLKQDGIDELNKIAKDSEAVKATAKKLVIKE